LTLSLCLSVFHKLQIDSSFCFSLESSHFWPLVLHDPLYKTLFFDFWFMPPNVQNLLPKICTESPISQLVWQIDRRCLGIPGGFRGWPIQWNHAKCCRPTLVAMATKFGLFCTKSPISRLVWQIDRRCLGLRLPGGCWGWPIVWNHAKCCGADLCCHGKEIWARRGNAVAYRLVLVIFCTSDMLNFYACKRNSLSTLYTAWSYHPRSKGDIIFSNVCLWLFLFVDSDTITPELLEIPWNIQGIILSSKEQTSSKMAIWCAGDLTCTMF